MCVLGSVLGTGFSGPAFLDLGPNDSRYVRNFRDPERDGVTWARWSQVPASQVLWPHPICGATELRLRARRHLETPASLDIFFNSHRVGSEVLKARADEPYEVLSFPLSEGTCVSRPQVELKSTAADDRGLGTTVDWIEIRTQRLWPRFSARSAASLAIVTWVLFFSIGQWLRGGRFFRLVGSLVSGLAIGSAFEPVSLERMIRSLPAVLLPVALLALLLRTVFPGRFVQGAVAIGIGAALLQTVFLHQRVFYPDYHVHAVVSRDLLASASTDSEFFAMQFRRSLGLQQVGDHWYPFPYPPGFYYVALVLARLFDLSAMESVVATGAAGAALLVTISVLLGGTVGLSPTGSRLAGAFIATAPLLARRIALGYFPSLWGAALDALALLCCLWTCGGRKPDDRIQPLVAYGMALFSACFFYTQALLNFGVLVGILIVATTIRRFSGARAASLALVSCLAVLGAFVGFYKRYLPVLAHLTNGTALSEEKVLTDLNEKRAKGTPSVDRMIEEANDPDAAGGLSLVRPVRKLARRTTLFFGPFGVFFWLGLLGIISLARELPPDKKIVVTASLLLFPLVTLLTAGFPGPNGFRHLKDLDFGSPLLAVGLAHLAGQSWIRDGRTRLIAVVVAVVWLGNAFVFRYAEWAARILPAFQR